MTDDIKHGVAQSMGQTKDNFEKAWAKRPWLNEEETDKDRAFRWWCAALAPGNGAVEADPLAGLVARFSNALLKKLRLAQANGRSGWDHDDWEADCQRGLLRHVEKGDPRDVAAYCAFMWHHGWATKSPSPAVLDPVTVEACAKVANKWVADITAAGDQFDKGGDIYAHANVCQGVAAAIRALIGQPASNGEPVAVEAERTQSVNKVLHQPSFDEAWAVFQNTGIDLVSDSDDETCRCLHNAIAAYLDSVTVEATDEYQPRTIERLIELLRSFEYGPRSWQSEAADALERLRRVTSTHRPEAMPEKLSPTVIAACVGGGITSDQITHIYYLIRAAVSLYGDPVPQTDHAKAIPTIGNNCEMPMPDGFSLVDDGRFCATDDPDCRHPECDCKLYRRRDDQ